MIPRYTPPEMGRIWTDQRRYDTWLLVELAAADAMAAHGVIPPTRHATFVKRDRWTPREWKRSRG